MRRESIIIPRIPVINSCLGASLGELLIAIGLRTAEGDQKMKDWNRRCQVFATTEYRTRLMMLQTCSAAAELVIPRHYKDAWELGSGVREIGSGVRTGWSRKGCQRSAMSEFHDVLVLAHLQHCSQTTPRIIRYSGQHKGNML